MDEDIYNSILIEHLKQRNNFPIFTNNDLYALRILTEEIGEVARALDTDDVDNLKEELLQTAVVCIRWLERML